MQTVYADNAAATKIRPEVLLAMLPYLTEYYGNPSSLHSGGIKARQAVEDARSRIAAALNTDVDEVYFTSSGTESDNWAITGIADAYRSMGKHIITSAIEHPAVLNALDVLKRRGYSVTYLGVDRDGRVSPEELERAIRPDTILITVMFANNETGVIQPITEIGNIARKHNIPFHTDGVQAVGQESIDVKAMNIDLLSLSGHKLYAPKGIGALYIRNGIKISPLIHGGGQEREQRAGTENVAGIVGLGAAIEIAVCGMAQERARLTALRDRLIDGILTAVPDCRLNGCRSHRLAGNAHFSFKGIDGEALVLLLDKRGIAVSSASACASGAFEQSHVLTAMGFPKHAAWGTLRISLGVYNAVTDVDYILSVLPDAIAKLRGIAPTI